jgi:hypothetical protein
MQLVEGCVLVQYLQARQLELLLLPQWRRWQTRLPLLRCCC